MIDVTITYLTPERFKAERQVGVHITQEWHSLVRNLLAWPRFAVDKKDVGALCPCALEGGVVKGGRGPVGMLTADVDDVTEGAIDRSAAALERYAAVVAPTFHAVREKPKHRIFVLLSRALAPDEFPLAWWKMARELAAVGIVVDGICKNINRLYFAPAAPSPAAWLGARVLTGEPVEADALVATAREEFEAEAARARASRRAPVVPAVQHRGKYIAAALSRAAQAVASAPEGDRNVRLNAEAFALARLEELDDATIASVLEDAALAAGLSRGEAQKTIGSALRARRRSA